MPKRVFIIHGWEGNANSKDWIPWLSRKLKSRGFKVNAPNMPNTNEPKIRSWVRYLEKRVGKPDSETYFVGHSLGCQAILRYLETLPDGVKVGGACSL